MENTYKKSLRQLFIEQKRCDVTFLCKNDDDKWEKVGAHKFWLSLVSDVFETMFYGKCVKGSAVKDGQDIEIQDIGIDSFKLFLG